MSSLFGWNNAQPTYHDHWPRSLSIEWVIIHRVKLQSNSIWFNPWTSEWSSVSCDWEDSTENECIRVHEQNATALQCFLFDFMDSHFIIIIIFIIYTKSVRMVVDICVLIFVVVVIVEWSNMQIQKTFDNILMDVR